MSPIGLGLDPSSEIPGSFRHCQRAFQPGPSAKDSDSSIRAVLRSLAAGLITASEADELIFLKNFV